MVALGRGGSQYCAAVDAAIELRQLRYFVAVAEELHFGRAAERLHMSQSPLSRAIRELERDLGVVLFVRTTRRVELTVAGSELLERSRRALAEIDGAIAEVRRFAEPADDVLAVGYGPFSGAAVASIVDAVALAHPGLKLRLEEEVTPDLLRRVGAQNLAAATVMESPAAARRHHVRVDALKDEPLLAALPAAHPLARERAVPIAAFAAECVLLLREPSGQMFNDWLRAVLRAHGVEIERTMTTASAPWDRRVVPVASGKAVAVVVSEWAESMPNVVTVPFDPPLSFPVDLASRWPPTTAVQSLVEAALRFRDAEGWLTSRRATTQLPED
jgi:DNA-binding transcriptional LysR family regulator